MKIIITSVGTRGDLEPYLGLAIGLKESGHEVQIVSSKNESTFVQSHGIDFLALDVDIREIMERREVREMAKGNNPFRFIVSHLKGSNSLRQLMLQTQKEIWNFCAGADIVIFHPGMPLAYFWAEASDKKAILATPFPVVSTNLYPSILFYSLPKFGKYFNLLTHYIFDKLFWAISKPPIKKFWQENIKTRINLHDSPLKQQIRKNQLVLNGYSKILFPHSNSWPPNIHTTGNWTIPADNTYLPAKDLIDFIADGAPPVYIGFGSMKDMDNFANTLQLIVEALNFTRQRAIVGLGWTKNSYRLQIPASIHLIENVPHGWLFPKMKLVVHHGGAGTTANGLRAGKPTVIIPHNADQPGWGKRVFELGVGPKPIKKTKLTAQKLAFAIEFAQRPEIVENAVLLGKRLSSENGILNAVKIINRLPHP